VNEPKIPNNIPMSIPFERNEVTYVHSIFDHVHHCASILHELYQKLQKLQIKDKKMDEVIGSQLEFLETRKSTLDREVAVLQEEKQTLDKIKTRNYNEPMFASYDIATLIDICKLYGSIIEDQIKWAASLEEALLSQLGMDLNHSNGSNPNTNNESVVDLEERIRYYEKSVNDLVFHFATASLEDKSKLKEDLQKIAKCVKKDITLVKDNPEKYSPSCRTKLDEISRFLSSNSEGKSRTKDDYHSLISEAESRMFAFLHAEGGDVGLSLIPFYMLTKF
jgi:hypothetical protein